MPTLSELLPPGNLLTAENAAVLKNKTIDGNQNTWVNLQPAIIRTPVITSPSGGATEVVQEPTIEGAPYAPLYDVDTRDYRQLQIDTSAGDFSSPVVDQQEDADNITVSTPLDFMTNYKARIRDVATTGDESDWSTEVGFTTITVFAVTPTLVVQATAPTLVTETPTLTTSAFATTPPNADTHLNTDWQVLDGSGNVVWESLADAVNKTSIEVPAGNLQVNTTYTFRARHRGTFAEVSPYAAVVATTRPAFILLPGDPFGGGFYAGNIVQGGTTYRLVISPKASGQSGLLQFKTSNTAAPTATRTLNNGPAASASMTGSTYPAANFCNNLTINGFSDWYLPARDELELCYRNLKPTVENNWTQDRPFSSIVYPEGNDVFSDTAGRNRNSSPAGAAYTVNNPQRTVVTAFRSTGDEFLENGGHWTSSEFSTTDAWLQQGNVGVQFNLEKTFSFAIARAVRRVAL